MRSSRGKVKVTVVSEQGKETVIAILGANEFFGEGCLAGQKQRIATAATFTMRWLNVISRRLSSSRLD
jgi:CRP-like cAMP-binding protein